MCFTIGCRSEDYRTKAIVVIANMPLEAHNSTTPPALLKLYMLGGYSPKWMARDQEATVVPQALGVLLCPTRGPLFPSPAQPSPATLGASPRAEPP